MASNATMSNVTEIGQMVSKDDASVETLRSFLNNVTMVSNSSDVFAISLAAFVLVLILFSFLQGLHCLGKQLHYMLCSSSRERPQSITEEEKSSLMEANMRYELRANESPSRASATETTEEDMIELPPAPPHHRVLRAPWHEEPEKAKDLKRREVSPPGQGLNQPMPSSIFSAIAIAIVGFFLYVFLRCTRIGQLIMLGCFFGIWCLIKVRYAVITNAILGNRLNEDGELSVAGQKPSSFQQCMWRHYYLCDQGPGLLVRCVGWFSIIAFIALSLCYCADGGMSMIGFEWHSVSLTSCHSIECCLALSEADWDMDRVQPGMCKAKVTLPKWLPKQLQGPEHCSIQSMESFRTYCQVGACHSTIKESDFLCRIKRVKYFLVEKWFTVLVVLVLLSRFKKIIFYLCVPLPEKPKDWKNDPDFLNRIGVVIPCHMSGDEIENTVRSILRFIPPQNIVVVDNANKPQPPDNTRQVVADIHPDINYVFVPIGLKTLAIWTGMQRLPPHVEYLMHVDDDTELPEDMVFDESHFHDPTVSEVAYAIQVRPGNLLQNSIGVCFQVNTQAGVFNNATSGTILWAAGIIGLVRRHVFMTVLTDHLFLPFGEDCYHGFLQLMNGYKIVREARSAVITFAPPVFSTLCSASSREQGYGAASLWKQRALRWMVTRLRRGPWMLLLLLTYQGGSLWKNVWFRINECDKFFKNILALLAPIPLARLVFDLYVGGDATFVCTCSCLLLLLNYFVHLIQFSVINYCCWSHRPDFQASFTTIAFVPIVKGFLHFCQMVGHVLCLTYWIPFVPTRVWTFTHGQDYASISESGAGNEILRGLKKAGITHV